MDEFDELICIPEGTNLSEINIEDIINIELQSYDDIIE